MVICDCDEIAHRASQPQRQRLGAGDVDWLEATSYDATLRIRFHNTERQLEDGSVSGLCPIL